MKAIKHLQDIFVTRKQEMHCDVDELIVDLFEQAIKEFEELKAKTHCEEFKLIEQLKSIDNDEANDFLRYFKRDAEATIGVKK